MLKSVNDMYFKEEIEVQIDKIKKGEILASQEELKKFINEIRAEDSGLTGVDKKELIGQLIGFVNEN